MRLSDLSSKDANGHNPVNTGQHNRSDACIVKGAFQCEMWFFMDSHTKSRWLGICAEIAVCEDAQRLAELQIEIMDSARTRTATRTTQTFTASQVDPRLPSRPLDTIRISH